MANSSVSARTRIIALDDYADLSKSYLDEVRTRFAVDIESTTKTLNPNIESDLERLVEMLQPYEVIITMRERTPFQRALLTKLPKLKLLLTTGMRNLALDLDTCKERSVIVAGTTYKPNPVLNQSDTNEQNWALLLGLAKNIADDDLRLKTQPEGWQGDMVYALAGRTLGLLGLGRLGLQCAVTGILGFGMTAIAWSSSLTQEKADEAGQERGLPAGSIRVMSSKEDLLRNADVLSIHYVLSDRSRGMLGAHELALMKKTALLINTSRGPIVDEDALLETLTEGRIRGAAMDVFNVEPLPADSPWRSQQWGKNGRSHVLLSPHTGYNEEETMHWMWKQTRENLTRWLSDEELINKLE